jgi:hypothetical protein
LDDAFETELQSGQVVTGYWAQQQAGDQKDEKKEPGSKMGRFGGWWSHQKGQENVGSCRHIGIYYDIFQAMMLNLQK